MKTTRRQILTDRESAFFYNIKCVCACVRARICVNDEYYVYKSDVIFSCKTHFQEIIRYVAVRVNELTTITDALHPFVFHSHLLTEYMSLNGK